MIPSRRDQNAGVLYEKGEPVPVPARTVMSSNARSGPTAPAVSRSGAAPRRRRPRRLLRQVTGVVVVVILWEVVVKAGLVSGATVPDPATVARAVGDNAGSLAPAAGRTLEDWLSGLVGGTVLGILLGVLVGLSAWAEAATDAIVRMMRPMPALALIPIAILVLGLGWKMTAGLVAFSTFWPVFINVRYGVRHIDPGTLEAAAALRLPRLARLRQVILPASAPYAAAGIQIAIGVGIVVTVSVQLVTGNEGLGQLVLTAEQSGSTPLIYAGIFVGALLGWAVNALFLLARRRLLVWHERGANA